MANLNLKHLRYFWAVAANGSIAQASEILHLTPQTISDQLRELEEQIGVKLFRKSGRNLVLIDTGQTVFSYTDEMFRLGNELQDVLAGRTPGSCFRLNVGIAMMIPKLLAYRLLAPVLELSEPVNLVCHEAPRPNLLAGLSIHKLDLVLADSPLSPTFNVWAYNHIFGGSGISFFAAHSEASKYSSNFPHSLNSAPMLMPIESSALRRGLELWLERQDINPVTVAEF
jgi:LysR family transcriptional activator of nhaA